MRVRRLLPLVLMLALVASGCSGDGGGDSGGAARVGKYSASDMPKMVLDKSHSPAGTDYDPSAATEISLEDFAQSDDERKQLKDLGFEGALGCLFATKGVLGTNIANAPKDGRIYACAVMIFRDEQAALHGMDLLVDKTVAGGESITVVDPPSSLGRAKMLKGRFQNIPYPGITVYWAQGNAVATMLASGEKITDAEVTSMATIMHERIAKV